MSIVISQHICEHWNYRVCFVENGKCKNCGWKTPELEAIDKEIAYEKEDFEESKIKIKDPCDCVVQPCDHYDGEMQNINNWIIFWQRLELSLLKHVTYNSKEEFLEYQNRVNELMTIENSALATPAPNIYRSCRRMGDNQW